VVAPRIRPHTVNGVPDDPAPVAIPAAGAPAAAPAEGEGLTDQVIDWMGSLDERVEALGKAMAALVGAETAALTGGMPATPGAPAAPASTTVEAAGTVATEAAAKAKRKIGLLW